MSLARQDDIHVSVITVSVCQTNCYIISNTTTKEAILFDPGDSGKDILEQIKQEGVTIKAILLTHGHFDHIGAVEQIQEQYPVPVYVHQLDVPLLADPKLNCSALFGLPSATAMADHIWNEEETVTIAGFKIQVIHTPGHTAGGVCYYLVDYGVLVSGDTLFHSTVGRTDFPTGSNQDMVKSVREKLFALPDETVVLPGHNDETTIGYEKKYNAIAAY